MTTTEIKPVKTKKRFFWIFLIIIGLLHLLPTISGFCIPCVDPNHWDWLTREQEVVDYLAFVWQNLSLFEAGLSLVMMAAAIIGYRRRERLAWYLSWFWLPVLIGEMILSPWSWPILVPLIVILVLGQLWTYSYFFR